MPRILITGFCSVPGPNRAGVQLGHVIRALASSHAPLHEATQPPLHAPVHAALQSPPRSPVYSPAYSIDVLVVRRAEQAHLERMGNARILRVPLSEGGLRSQIESFRRALRRQLEGADYDIVHVLDSWSGIPVLEMRGRLEYATVFDAARSSIAEVPELDLALAAEIARDQEACMRGADVVLVPTEMARGSVMHENPDRVHVVPPGVDVDRFDWDELPPGRPAILYAGMVEPGRGVRVLLRAMAYVLRCMDARLIIAGATTPEFASSLTGAIRELGLEGSVELMGEVDHHDMPALIARATVCVAPTALESSEHSMALYPTKILEYMACRRAVVAPRRGTVAQLVRSGVNGLVFTPADPADLARKLIKLLEDHDLRGRLAEAGYQTVRQGYTASATRRAMRKAYAYITEHVPWGRSWGSKASALEDQKPALPVLQRSALPGFVGDGLATDTGLAMEPGLATDPGLATEPGLVLDPGSVATELSDTTDEYEIPSAREHAPSLGHDRHVAGHGLSPSRLHERLSSEIPLYGMMEGDDWIVSEQHLRRGLGGPASPWRAISEDDEHGTSIDVRAVPAPAVPEEPELDQRLDNRLVVGEVDVPTPAPDVSAEDALYDGASFTAMSVLLGTLDEDTDGAGRSKPE